MALPDIFAQAGIKPTNATPKPTTVSPQPKITTPITTPFDTGSATKVVTPAGNTSYQTPAPVATQASAAAASTNRNSPPTDIPPAGYEYKWLSLPGTSGTGQWKLYPIAGYVGTGGAGGTTTVTAVPGSTGLSTTGTRTLAADTFANTLAVIFGAQEASQPYVAKLYSLVSNYYKTGSTVDEALNLAIREARTTNVIPEFTKRFAGIFALDDQLKAGKAVSVPTIAEFFAAEAKMGEVLTNAGLGDLATQEFLGGVIGKGKSVLEVSNLISNTFSTIDNAPAALKATLSTYFPGVDRASIAKALLTGAEGAAALDKKIKGISVLSAAGSQGITTDLATASDVAAQGYDYQQALTGFGTVNQLQRANTIAEFSGNKFTQAQAMSATFGKSIEEKNKLEQLAATEQGRFGASSGTSKGAFSTSYLNRQGKSGAF